MYQVRHNEFVGIFPERKKAWNIGQKNMVGTSSLGTWNGPWMIDVEKIMKKVDLIWGDSSWVQSYGMPPLMHNYELGDFDLGMILREYNPLWIYEVAS